MHIDEKDVQVTSPQRKAIKVLKNRWESIKGKWYGVNYKGSKGKKPMLYVEKLLNRFLVDKDGPVESLLMECLQPKVGSGNDLKHLPDIDNFPVKNIICGPLEVIPKEQDSENILQ